MEIFRNNKQFRRCQLIMQLYLKAQSAIIINHIKMLDSEQSHVLINSFKSDYKTPNNSNVEFKIISFNNMKKKRNMSVYLKNNKY